MSQKSVAIIVCVCTVLVVAAVSVSFTLTLLDKNGAFALMDDTQGAYLGDYERLDEVYRLVMNEYYVDVDPDKLMQGAIDGMLASLDDPYTFYYTPEILEQNTARQTGEYKGIGVQVAIFDDSYLYVTRVFENGPAWDAGLQIGDILLAADGLELRAANSDELSDAVANIQGEEGTFVNMTVKRGDSEFEIPLERRAVIQNRVEYQMLDNDVLLISLYEFYGSAADEFETALNYAVDNGAKAVIVDVRANPGGQLDICLRICDMLLPEGVIVYTQDRWEDRQYYYSDAEYYDLPLAVLVNGASASASELFSAAIQDYSRGTIVGTTTYGKGIVQSCHTFLSGDAGMQLTTSAYYAPSGRSIHKVGVEPDIVVESGVNGIENYLLATKTDSDPQLKAAYDAVIGVIGETDDE